ncbi:MAG TPA: VCBS repeat-containing protein, partial [Blastocatellia bacterium]|nr:VCBS repeat-containing protein [Blastocatellia bacterium]
AGDYDGDGRTDLAVFRRATGTWLVKGSGGGKLISKQWGIGSDAPVPADYDGDGKTDFAVWRASTGTWYIWQSSTNEFRQLDLGGRASSDDQAIPGDYDGDGQADVAVWQAATNTWLVKCSSDNRVLTQGHGQAGDAPVNVRRQ